jgi:diguanylate cyclase (GGDEF)-like protein
MKLIRSRNKEKLKDKSKKEAQEFHRSGVMPDTPKSRDSLSGLDMNTWKMLIVDDEPDVHEITRIALKGFTFDGKKLELVSAYSAKQAREILRDDQNFSAAMIDVVMETEEAGLDLVRFIREDMGLSHIRLIVRTGQPGKAPEKYVIDNFDIDDYKEKTDLTTLKMYTMSRSSLKSYRDILTIEMSRLELEQKVKERTLELQKANKELIEISLTDALTKLPNRRHALQQLSKHWEESTKKGKPLSLMMIDADHFKEINDTYGHDAGDAVLCELARTLQHSVRTDDFVCRLGGDEFLIICPKTDRKGGLNIAEIVRSKVSEMSVKTGDGFWNGSVSIGLAAYHKNMKNYEALIKAADEGVYEAKKAGKNCVRTSKNI